MSEKVKNFDPARTHPHKTKIAVAEVRNKEDGGESWEISIPLSDSEQDVKQVALEFAQLLRRAESVMRQGVAEAIAKGFSVFGNLLELSAHYIVINLLAIYAERSDPATDTIGFGTMNQDEGSAWTAAAKVRLTTQLKANTKDFTAENARQARSFYQNIGAYALLGMEAEVGAEKLSQLEGAEFDDLFDKHFELALTENTQDILMAWSQEIARDFLEELDPASMPLEELVSLLRGDQSAGGALKEFTGTFTIATSQLMPAMHEHLTSKALMTTRDLSIKEGKRALQVRVKSYADFNASPTKPPEEVLKRMHKSLLAIKRYGAALLKTQLDLMNEGYRAGGQLPTFFYNLSDALERQGYAKQSHGAYDPTTMESLRRRVVTLAYQNIEVLELSSKKNNSRYIDATPYWIIEATRRLTEGDEFNHSIILLGDPNTPIVTGFAMRPGLWWPIIGMGQYRLEIPSSVLELSTDGNGNEVERLALQLTPTLAIWERSSQNARAGKDWSYGVGTLLEAASYITRDEFMSGHSETAKRTRDYLASTDGTSGALPLLDRLGAFTLDIKDEADFFASGRGWREKFWESQIRLSVRNLKLAKKPRGT